MKLRTELALSKGDFSLTHQDKILSIGSCFAQEIGERLQQAKFQTQINPFGIQFHPLGIENCLARIYGRQFYTQNEIFHFNEKYFSWDHHSSFSKPTPKATLNGINEKLEEALDFLNNAKLLIITLGTAWVYTLNSAQTVVSNCHKVPQKNFSKRLLQTVEIETALQHIIAMAKDANPAIHILFTVSPVRHIKDGMVENNLSKSLLIHQLHQVISQHEKVNYFPAYELVMDDLRDYRFYESDMLHPNSQAVDYIWSKFGDVFFTPTTLEKNKVVKKIQNAVAHKPFHAESLSHKKFLFDTLKYIEKHEPEFPRGIFQQEKEILKHNLHHAD